MIEEYRDKLKSVQEESDIIINKLRDIDGINEEQESIYQKQRMFLDDLISKYNSNEFNREIDWLAEDITQMQKNSLYKLEEYKDDLTQEKKKLENKEDELLEEYKRIEDSESDINVD